MLPKKKPCIDLLLIHDLSEHFLLCRLLVCLNALQYSCRTKVTDSNYKMHCTFLKSCYFLYSYSLFMYLFHYPGNCLKLLRNYHLRHMQRYDVFQVKSILWLYGHIMFINYKFIFKLHSKHLKGMMKNTLNMHVSLIVSKIDR